MSISLNKRGSVSAEAMTYTTHVVQVDLADLLGQYDVTDQVVVMITTPSGRSKRVTLAANFLVAPHHTDTDIDAYTERY